MEIDFKPFFEQYDALVKTVDDTFEKVKGEYPDEVKCKIECSDCCHAIFDITLIEALYINHQFNRKFEGKEKESILEKANRVDRKLYKLKKKAYQEYQKGRNEGEIIADFSVERSRCPLLNQEDRCDLYDHRPITCRFYGIPTSIGGKGHTCGLSGFKTGKPYPTVNLDIINERLSKISSDLVSSLPTRYVRMAEMVIPVSMALLTVYDDEYLGISEKDTDEKGQGEKETKGV
jgi:Fe-S-cluster containining protein